MLQNYLYRLAHQFNKTITGLSDRFLGQREDRIEQFIAHYADETMTVAEHALGSNREPFTKTAKYYPRSHVVRFNQNDQFPNFPHALNRSGWPENKRFTGVSGPQISDSHDVGNIASITAHTPEGPKTLHFVNPEAVNFPKLKTVLPTREAMRALFR